MKKGFPHKVISFFTLIKEGKKLRDKLILIFRLIICGLLYPFAKIFKINISNLDKLLIVSNIVIRNEDGEFFCRRGTSDFFVVSSLHESGLKDFFTPFNGIFVDIGAHIGKYTVRMAKQCKLVIAIEPNPSNFEILRKNLSINNIKNCIPLKVAVLNKSGYCYLYSVTSVDTGSSTIIEKKGEKVKVRCKKLDEIFKELKIMPNEIKMVKIDVEGAEALVLKGAIKFLTSATDLKIIFESSPQNFKECKRILDLAKFKIIPLEEKNYYLAIKRI